MLTKYQIDLVHFGVVFQLNIMIGLLTPPIGMLLYVITGVSGIEMNEILRDLWPFLIAIALVLILIYVSFRFDYRFGIAAVIALFHDAIFTIGVLVITQREFSIVVVGALLTIIGYSINDSIVISDRIREKYKKMRKEPYNVVLNTGLNEVLSRTILTVGTTLLAVIALLIFGGPVIADFAFTLLVGFVIGTYSSIFIVASIVSVWEERFPKKKK